VSDFVYRILTQEQWAEMQRTGILPLSPIDVRDGYIHLSLLEQINGTANRYFQEFDALVVVSFAVEVFGQQLKLEGVASRDGQKFPHFYGEIVPFGWISTIYCMANVNGIFGPLQPF